MISQSGLVDRLVRKSHRVTVWFLCGDEFHSHEGMPQLQFDRDELLVASSVNGLPCFHNLEIPRGKCI
jgi:hypothetical protein